MRSLIYFPTFIAVVTPSIVLQEILEADAALDLVDDDLICPVCLDLLHEPFGSMPCKHRFCEPCLRRLGSKNPMNTLCPMCRSRIMFCEPLTRK